MDAAIYALTAMGVVLLVWYYIVYDRAERPREGTLEWIDFYDRPKTALLACGKRFSWKDALWVLIPAAAAAVSVILAKQSGTVYDAAPGVALRVSVDRQVVLFDLTLISAVFAAAAAYLLLKALTGRVLASLAGALLYAVGAEDAPISCLLLAGLLFFWLWAGYPRRAGLGLFFLCLGSFLIGAGTFCFGFPAIVLSFVCALLFALIRRMREEDRGAGYFTLFLFAALLSAVVGFGAVFALAAQGADLAPFSAEAFAFLADAAASWIVLLLFWLSAPALDGSLLFEYAAFLSALIPLWVLWRRRRDGGALFLLIWSLPLTLLYILVPIHFPIVPACLICGWLTGRLLHRGHPVAAVFGAVGGVAVYALLPLLLEFLSLSFYY